MASSEEMEIESFRNYEDLQIENVCRVCLAKNEDMTQITEGGISDMLFECASVQLPTEDSLICSPCATEVSYWYEFKQRVVRSFEIARWILIHHKEKSIVISCPIINKTQAVQESVYKPEYEDCESSIDEEFSEDGQVKCEAVELVDERRFKCDECDARFFKKQKLMEHTRKHTGERPYKCDICDNTFARRFSLKSHAKVHMVREKSYSCELCNKTFLTNAGLTLHKKKHTGIKPFACSECDKRFFVNIEMQRHYQAIHDTSNNFLCSFCPKVYATKSQLSDHIKKKHTENGLPANAVCTECGKQCGSLAELRIHMRTHTGERPFICEFCSKGFITRGNLNSHRRTHTGEKPFVCEHCNKAFSDTSALKVHIRIHTGARPYECHICAKTFTQCGSLKTHMKSH